MADKPITSPPPPSAVSLYMQPPAAQSSTYLKVMTLFNDTRVFCSNELTKEALADLTNFVENKVALIKPGHFYRDDELLKLTTEIYLKPDLSGFMDALMFRFFASLGTADNISEAVDLINNALFYGLDWSYPYSPPRKVKENRYLSMVPQTNLASMPLLCLGNMLGNGDEVKLIPLEHCNTWLEMSKTFLLANRHLLATLFLYVSWSNSKNTAA